MKRCSFSLVCVLVAAAIWSGCAPRPLTADAAPDFSLENLDGDAVILSELKGQIVVLDFWASWCLPCIDSFGVLQALHERYADQGVVVLAVNIEEERSHVADLVESYTFAVLLDTDGRATDAFGVVAIPHTAVVDRAGQVRYVPEGPEGVESVLLELGVE